MRVWSGDGCLGGMGSCVMALTVGGVCDWGTVSEIVEGVWRDVDHWNEMNSPKTWQEMSGSSIIGAAVFNVGVRESGWMWTFVYICWSSRSVMDRLVVMVLW